MHIAKAYNLVSRALKASRIPHALAGGMAANLLVPSGDARETHDVDFALATTYPDPASAVIAYLFKHGHYDIERLLDSRVSRKTAMPPYADILKITIGGIGVDFIVLRHRKYVATALKRAWSAKFAGQTTPLLSPEDLFLYKARAGRPRDFQPMSALSQMPRFNWKYVIRWSRLLGVYGIAKKFKGHA
jgi:hypothetical protein